MSTTPPQRAHDSVTTGQGSDVPRDLHQSFDHGERMQAGVDLAVMLIPACDHAGITQVDGSSIRSGATSDGLVAHADQIQHDLAQGPCVDAARFENRSLYVSDLATETRGPSGPIRSGKNWGWVVAIDVLFTHERSFGVMNLYADRPDAFTDDDFAIAESLAAHLAIAVSDSNEIQHRGTGMINRTVIGQAEGILMERYGIGPTEAFAVGTWPMEKSAYPSVGSRADRPIGREGGSRRRCLRILCCVVQLLARYRRGGPRR